MIGSEERPERNQVRRLGMTKQKPRNRSNLVQDQKTVTQLARIVARITKARKGIREVETLRLKNDLVISRIS